MMKFLDIIICILSIKTAPMLSNIMQRKEYLFQILWLKEPMWVKLMCLYFFTLLIINFINSFQLFVLITPKQRIKLLPLDTTTTNDDVSQNSGVHSSNSSNESTIMVNNNNNTTGYDLVRAKPKYNSKNAIMSNRSSSIHQNMEDTDSKGSRSLIAQTTITARINYTVLRSCTTLSNVAYSAPLNYSLPISKVCYIHSWLAACQPWQRMGGWEGDSSVSSLEESGSDYTRYSTDTEIPESASCWNLPRF